MSKLVELAEELRKKRSVIWADDTLSEKEFEVIDKNLAGLILLIRDKFTKQDWEEYISHTNNKMAKHEWTKMMNARFPEEK